MWHFDIFRLMHDCMSIILDTNPRLQINFFHFKSFQIQQRYAL